MACTMSRERRPRKRISKDKYFIQLTFTQQDIDFIVEDIEGARVEIDYQGMNRDGLMMLLRFATACVEVGWFKENFPEYKDKGICVFSESIVTPN